MAIFCVCPRYVRRSLQRRLPHGHIQWCPPLAVSGHSIMSHLMSLSGEKRTSLFATDMSAMTKVDIRRQFLLGHAPSGRATRHDANGSKCVDGLAMLVEGCPFDPSNALRFCLGRREFDHLTFEVKLIAGAYRGEPPQFIDAEAQQRMWSEWPDFNCQPHCNRRRMPP